MESISLFRHSAHIMLVSVRNKKNLKRVTHLYETQRSIGSSTNAYKVVQPFTYTTHFSGTGFMNTAGDDRLPNQNDSTCNAGICPVAGKCYSTEPK